MRLLTFIAISLLASPAIAAEFVAVGHVTQQTLMPYGAPHCPPACPASSSGQVICITNACGCGRAEIVIDRVLIGNQVPQVSVKYTLGEWCQPEYPISNPSVVIRIAGNGEPEWGQIRKLNSGVYVFYTMRFTTIGSVKVSSLKQHDGWASLSELEAKLGL